MEDYKKYIVRLTEDDIRIINSNVNQYGFDKIKAWFFRSIDCTRIVNGMRLNCTKHFTYKDALSSLIYLINQEDERDKQNDLYAVNEIHNKNIEFEKANPPQPLKKVAKEPSEKVDKKERIKFYQSQIFDSNFNFILNVNK